jgi:DNA-binding GntR family transcriptional regulator
MPVFQRFQRDAAYDRLLALIMSGRLSADRPLSERKLAEALDIGRTPVREAIKALAGDGVLEIRPARGTYLRGIELEELQELYEARQMLEAQAAFLAAERGPTKELSAHRERLEQVGRAGMTSGLDAINDMGRDFHLDVFRAARNSILLDLYVPIQLRFRIAAKQVVLSSADGGAGDHIGILDAIEAREPEKARRLMSEHLARSRDMMRSLLIELKHRTMRNRPHGANGNGHPHAGQITKGTQ